MQIHAQTIYVPSVSLWITPFLIVTSSCAVYFNRFSKSERNAKANRKLLRATSVSCQFLSVPRQFSSTSHRLQPHPAEERAKFSAALKSDRSSFFLPLQFYDDIILWWSRTGQAVVVCDVTVLELLLTHPCLAGWLTYDTMWARN